MQPGDTATPDSRGPTTTPGRPVFLTGMMGAGKTTIAPLVAARWRAEWVDLDTRIERVFGGSVADLFAQRGEDWFRRAEGQALRSLLDEPGVRGHTLVVATGGGTVVVPASRRALGEAGVVVYLRVPADALARRLTRSGALGNRPLLGGNLASVQGRMTELLAGRSAAYEAAHITVDADAEPSEVARRVCAAVMAALE